VTNSNNGLPLVAPRVTPVLDPWFRPAVLARRAFTSAVRRSGQALPVGIALEQADGNVSHFNTEIFEPANSGAVGNFTFLERTIKLLLWARGGYRVYLQGPSELASRLAAYYHDTSTGRFDSNLVGERMFDHPIELVHTSKLPPERRSTAALGRHLEGYRIGFDLG